MLKFLNIHETSGSARPMDLPLPFSRDIRSGMSDVVTKISRKVTPNLVVGPMGL